MDIIIQEWGLDASLHSKEEILSALAARIRQMLEHDPMGFIQVMYRLDISEAQLDAAMDADDAPATIATLVWERQMQKVMLRKAPPPRSGEDADLEW